jgi:hypothetical protein
LYYDNTRAKKKLRLKVGLFDHFFDQIPKTTFYYYLKVKLFVHNFLTWHLLKSGQLFTSTVTFLPIGIEQKDGVGGNTHSRPHSAAISVQLLPCE